ncbi:hypothetical protein Ciccas_000486 [Cichlidogyrus casuarinus]|uniref:BHLH domain-containing protein n=1 Tax=Cichlidogyrus casuarinus TaxID=1844966 RepID=A0ABD2QMR6_9PLAT
MDFYGPNLSCTDNSECDDSFSVNVKPDIKERRRKLHTEAEQRRRDAIKHGFDALAELVNPENQDSIEGSLKLSKVTILNKATSIINKNLETQQTLQKEILSLRKEVAALEIIRENYEKKTREINALPTTSNNTLDSNYKMSAFLQFSESLFDSFNTSLQIAPFPEISNNVIDWVEGTCSSDNLRQHFFSSIKKLPVTFDFPF